MTRYLYPQNMRATANLWLWGLRDFLIMGIAALLSIVILVELHFILPIALTVWSDGTGDIDIGTPEAFKLVTQLSQHIAFLKDFFRSYKDFSDQEIDTIEILLQKLYRRYGIDDGTDLSVKLADEYPTMSDFY